MSLCDAFGKPSSQHHHWDFQAWAHADMLSQAIAKELNASVSDTFGLTTSFLLCMTVAQPYFSEISWVAGRRTAFCLALALFGTGTIMCGCAKSSLVLLVGRAIQGAGAGGTEPVKALILFDLFDLRERSKWISYMNVSWALGTIAGPLLGGVFSENQSLTWVSPSC